MSRPVECARPTLAKTQGATLVDSTPVPQAMDKRKVPRGPRFLALSGPMYAYRFLPSAELAFLKATHSAKQQTRICLEAM